jgi:hypothetical protein
MLDLMVVPDSCVRGSGTSLDLVVFPRMTFKSLICHFGLATKPLLSPQLSVFLSFLFNSLKWFGLLAGEVPAVKTYINIVLPTALANAERRPTVSRPTTLLTNKP